MDIVLAALCGFLMDLALGDSAGCLTRWWAWEMHRRAGTRCAALF
ncbi:MAG: hypothetical protein ACLRRT_02015 [Ruthenibacterium lactatiformans]